MYVEQMADIHSMIFIKTTAFSKILAVNVLLNIYYNRIKIMTVC